MLTEKLTQAMKQIDFAADASAEIYDRASKLPPDQLVEGSTLVLLRMQAHYQQAIALALIDAAESLAFIDGKLERLIETIDPDRGH